MYLWNKKPLKVYGSRMSESCLSILCHIVNGEAIIKVGLSDVSHRNFICTCVADFVLYRLKCRLSQTSTFIHCRQDSGTPTSEKTIFSKFFPRCSLCVCVIEKSGKIVGSLEQLLMDRL